MNKRLLVTDMMDKTAKPVPFLRRFLADEDGAFIIEFAFAFPVLILLSFGLLEFSLVVFDYQRAAEATRQGTRFAILNNPIANTATVLEGSVISCSRPNGAVECVGGSPSATADADFLALLAQMQGIYPTLVAENISIIYEGTDVGDVDSSGGIFPMVTLELLNVKHDMIIGDLIGIKTINFPPFTTTVLGPGNYVNVAVKVGNGP
ncbi:MAG: pilus assembly protein [Proteobacteria bacterium]|nr:pilus assembly protein [Pseudomonadota bacterium]